MRIFLMILFLGNFISISSQLDSTIKDQSTYIKIGEDSLFANLIIPENAKHMVLIIAGSGPTDKDGNNPLGMNENYSYKMLAHQLYNNNIGSVRYDKRGIGSSALAFSGEVDFQFNFFIEDAVAILGHIKENYPDKKIIIAGHSQGSLVGMIAAQKESVDGFISLAGAGFPIDEVLKEQLKEQPKFFKDYALKVLDSIKLGIDLDTIYPPISNIFPENLQVFLRQWMSYDPLKEINKLNIPVLLINGTHDVQVSVDNVERLASERKQFKIKVIEGMSHVLKDAPKDKEENINTYNDISLPLNSEMIEEMLFFIKKIN
tara:strand:+ start:68 stop:1018 length:951 start_codon:yes stop_codon:yes gene_type:complete